MSLSRESFATALQAITEHERIISDVEKALTPLSVLPASLDFSMLHTNAIRVMLQETMQDDDDWISWWLYEDVEKIITWKENGKEIIADVTDVNALYDFLINEMEHKTEAKQADKENDIVMTFGLDDAQMQKLQEWRRSHSCKYRISDGRYDIGSGISFCGELETFRFVPTSVGVVIATCECACGEEIDLTDFSTF